MRSRRLLCITAAMGATAIVAAPLARAADEKGFTLTIKDHRFSPEALTAPAGEVFTLTVVNADPTAEEFESTDFHVEKVIGGGKQMTFHIGPLTAGSYGFFGERHMNSAVGNLFVE